VSKAKYSIYKKPSSVIVEYDTDSWQGAIDIWSHLKQLGNSPYINCVSEEKVMIVNSRSGIREWSDYLMLNNYNRVERRAILDMQDEKLDSMEVVEQKDTGNYGYNNYLQEEEDYEAAVEESNRLHDLVDSYKDDQKNGSHDRDRFIRFRDEIPSLMGKTFGGTPEFHGKFEEMDSWTQDQIINPKHYKLFAPEDYPRYPNGIEYMDLCEKALVHLTGVQAHLVGQILKYTLRVGKKDAMEQDAKKIEWYASRLVKTVKG